MNYASPLCSVCWLKYAFSSFSSFLTNFDAKGEKGETEKNKKGLQPVSRYVEQELKEWGWVQSYFGVTASGADIILGQG